MPEKVSIDWALKRLLRSKANFSVLEGLLTSLLKTKVEILDILEGESNRETEDSKQTRVDMKVRLESGEIVIIEVQSYREAAYLPRILLGATHVISDHIHKGSGFETVVKVISVSLLFDQRGPSDDYIYYGRTLIEGLHNGKLYDLTPHQRDLLHAKSAAEIFPRYYLLYIDQFDTVATTTLDEWIHFLKYHTLPPNFSAPGLAEAYELFDVARLSREDRVDYRHEAFDNWRRRDQLDTARAEGIEQGIAQGAESTARQIAHQLLDLLDDETIAEKTGLTIDDIRQLRNE